MAKGKNIDASIVRGGTKKVIRLIDGCRGRKLDFIPLENGADANPLKCVG